jgi:hypothetical protein
MRNGKGRKQKSKKTASEITPGVEKRIVAVSLKHPDYGARRLAILLEKEGIEVTDSAVYSILKRNGLQNRSLRLSKLAVQQGAGKSPVATGTVSPPVDQADRVSAHTEQIIPQLRVTRSDKSVKNSNSRRRWPLSILNLLLLAFAGFFCVSAVGNFTQARYEQGLSAEPASAQTTPESDISVRPLSDYDLIADRNLFGLAREGGPEHEEKQQEEIPLEEMPVAEKNLGLSLIGTVAAKKSKLRSAIIENSETRVQTIYHEGDKIEDILVKRILRDNVILGTSGGEKVLTIAFEQTSERSRSPNQPVSKKDETGGYSLKYQRRVRGMLTRSSGQSVSKHDQTVGDSSKPHRRVRGILRRK